MTPIRLTTTGRTLAAQLADNPTSLDLLAQLPLTLSFRDFGGQEKVAGLPRALTMDGVPEGDDPEVDDIGYYAPDGLLVLYYADVGYWKGIVRLGRLDPADTQMLKDQPDGFTVTMARA